MSTPENISATINTPPKESFAIPELAKSYEPSLIESALNQLWLDKKIGQVTIRPYQDNFCIQLPPPNVTGTLHMGHAFNQTIMDGLTRHARMQGKNTLWVQDKMYFPDTGNAPFPNPEMPETVLKLYNEASAISSKSPRGAAALLRLSIQVL
jgi:hypothetical protein